MSQDYPFRAEYAKSGRAGCKGCKLNIAQGSLRLAKMIQSPHFDGKIPTWFHYSCFFKKAKVKGTDEIEKFDSLRWDDQQRIKSSLTGGKASSSTSKSPDVKSLDAVDSGIITSSDFQIEYAKSGRSKCKKCEESIKKMEIRVSKMMLAEGARKFLGQIPNWYHVDCFAELQVDLEAVSLTPDQLQGFWSLDDEDQITVRTKLALSDKAIEQKPAVTAAKPSSSKDAVVKESAEEGILRKQNENFWKIRDQLEKTCSIRDLRDMCEANGYETSGGESRVLDRCADGMLFGALKLCPECKHGRLFYKDEGYSCSGNISAWTPCTYVTKEPERRVWVIPEDTKVDNPFLSSMKCKVGQRIFPSSLSADLSGLPLWKKVIVFIGKMKTPKRDLVQKVSELGGSVSESVSANVHCCISSPEAVLQHSIKMMHARQRNVPVVSEEYLHALAKGDGNAVLAQYALAPWGGETQPKTGAAQAGVFVSLDLKRKYEEAEGFEKKAKMTMKGGAVVDPESGLEGSCHVLSRGKDIFSVVLGLVDLMRGTNSYYKLQVLQHDTRKSKFFLYRSWGRVGTPIGGNKVEKFSDENDAVDAFQELYHEKTGNPWGRGHNFSKFPGKFYPIDIDYGQDDEVLQSKIAPGSVSKLSDPVKQLIKLIFDVEAMKDALIEFEIDLKKMPLGKLSKKQIEAAYAVLSECQRSLTDGSSANILDASNRFFTLIPHDFGLKKPPLLDNEELIRLKIDMLNNLLDIEVAYSLLKGDQGDEDQDPLDVHYEKLKADIHEIPKDGDVFEMIKTYVKNTHAKTHSNFSLEVEEVFVVNRQGEAKRYKSFRDLHNRQLLWHGSRTTNFVGIISQGLRIAPPEAPVTGYMFGKGVYFADMASKSANYCHTSPSNRTGLMLLCEVALGNMYELLQAQNITKLPAGKHSVKGVGRTEPDPSGNRTLDDGVLVPLGKGMQSKTNGTSLLYNEYIVYDTAQINIKYLVKLKFMYK